MAENSGDLSLGYMMGQSEGNNGGGFGGSFGEGLWAVIILAILFGRGGFGWGGNEGGSSGSGSSCGGGGWGWGYGAPWATQADVRNAVDQQTLISKLDQQTYGLADSTYALNNSIANGFAGVQQTLCQGFNGVNTAMLQGFHGVDNAVCNLGYQTQAGFNALGNQLAQCCCDTRAAIKDVNTQSIMNTSAIQRQISDCCCDLEKMDMQGRFDAQVYNSNTLMAIDKLGDRIIDYMASEKAQALRDENQALRLAASQANQNNVIRAAIDASTAEIIRRTGNDCPVPAYVVPNPNCCYGNPLGVGYNYGFGGYGGQREGGCGCC